MDENRRSFWIVLFTSAALLAGALLYRKRQLEEQEMTSGTPPLSVGVIGAGTIGTICGLSLSKSRNLEVTLVGRQSLLDAVQTDPSSKVTFLQFRDRSQKGSKRDDIQRFPVQIVPDNGDSPNEERLIKVTTDLRQVVSCSIIIISVKTTATESIAKELAEKLPQDSTAIILSFQNGVRNASILRQALENHQRVRVQSCMVGFNGFLDPQTRVFTRSTDGGIQMQRPKQGLPKGPLDAFMAALTAGQLPSGTVADIQSTLYSKLLINLFNAVNALAGVSTVATLEQKGYRRVWAAAIQEGLDVYRRRGIVPATFRGLPPTLLPFLSVLPDAAFWLVLRGIARMDDSAKSSMLQDLERRRAQTEVPDLCGEIERLGVETSTPTPVNSALVRLVVAAQVAQKGPPCLSAQELLRQVGLEGA